MRFDTDPRHESWPPSRVRLPPSSAYFCSPSILAEAGPRILFSFISAAWCSAHFLTTTDRSGSASRLSFATLRLRRRDALQCLLHRRGQLGVRDPAERPPFPHPHGVHATRSHRGAGARASRILIAMSQLIGAQILVVFSCVSLAAVIGLLIAISVCSSARSHGVCALTPC